MRGGDEAARPPAERAGDTEQLVRQAHATERSAIRERDGIAGRPKPNGSAELSSREATQSDVQHAPADRHQCEPSLIRRTIAQPMMSSTPSTMPAVARPEPPSVGSIA